MTARTNADSLCTQPAQEARLVHRYFGERGDLKAEIVAVVASAFDSIDDEIDATADILAVLRTCATGDLLTGADDTDVLEPVRTQPELWELKWRKRGKRKAEFRLYHAEKEGDIGLLALRFHVKFGRGPQVSSSDQDREMQEAFDRLDGAADRSSAWGHASSGCVNCID